MIYTNGKPKRGRPRGSTGPYKPVAERRSVKFTFWLTEAERERLDKASAGMSPSAWIRAQIDAAGPASSVRKPAA